MIKLYIQKYCYTLEYKVISPLSNSFNNICNVSNDGDPKKDYFDENNTDISDSNSSESMSSLI